MSVSPDKFKAFVTILKRSIRMKRIGILWLMLFVSLFSAAGTSKPTATLTWNLWKDVGATSNQVSFSQGSNGVWYFLESGNFSHDPFSYQFLTDYQVQCKTSAGEVPIDGVPCWRDPAPDNQGNTVPEVGFNFTDATQFILPGLPVPPRSLFIHPGMTRLGIVGWKSPVNGSVSIVGSFKDLDSNCGNGVLWSIDNGSNTLRSGDLSNGGAERFSFSSPVKKNQVLYFIVDPKDGDYFCDTTKLKLVITR
jgi:hypothetical protein